MQSYIRFFDFPIKAYKFGITAGRYNALKVVLGDGKEPIGGVYFPYAL